MEALVVSIIIQYKAVDRNLLCRQALKIKNYKFCPPLQFDQPSLGLSSRDYYVCTGPYEEVGLSLHHLPHN